jgi:uncharacterized protein YbjT (DUF2867 family)
MTTPAQLTVAVIGATGQQGRSVIDALLADGVPVRALVRDPNAPAARALLSAGVDVVKADQEDPGSLEDALTGVASLFFMTTFEGPDGTDGEVRRGRTVADAAARANVPRVVYSSVGGAERGTGVPHFESKFQVEQYLRALMPATTLRPVFFMENLTPQLSPDENGEIIIRLPMPGDIPVQMIAVRDIGRAAARLLSAPDAIEGNAVEVAGDEVTLNQVATLVGEIFGMPARFETIPLEYLGDDEDLKAMFRWFAEGDAYKADLERSRVLIEGSSNLRDWLTTHRTTTAGTVSR